MSREEDLSSLDRELSASDPFEDGFNSRSIVAAVFIGVVMLPGAIYMSLVDGSGIGAAAPWVTVILFVEIAKRSFVTLRKQEIFIIFIIASGLLSAGAVMGATGLVLPGGIFGTLVWDQYFRQSSYARLFEIRDLIPNWVVPPADSEALFKRTFFHPAWLAPLAVLLVHQVLFKINTLTLGYALFRMTSDVEKLPFPLAPVGSEGCLALAETSGKREGWRWQIFSTGTMIGVLFGALRVGVPTLTGLFMTTPVQLIPIPWVDFTSEIGNVLPAAAIGMTTDLALVLAGFVIPFAVVAGTFISSMVSYLVINPICQHAGIIHSWRPGMGVIPTSITTRLDLWLSVTIGAGIIIGLIGIWRIAQTFHAHRSRERMIDSLPEGRGDMPIWLALALWFLATTGSVVLCHMLVPDFPVWIFCVFGYVFSPFISYIGARMYGMTGSVTGIQFPMVKEGTFILSGRGGAAIWFAPIPFFDQAGGLAETYKQLELTRTKFTSFFKAVAVTFLIMAVCSFLFWSLIWKMGPIPSASYPYVHKMWPLFAMGKALWVTSTMGEGNSWILEALDLKLIATGAAGGGLLYVLIGAMNLPVGFFYGIVGGVAMLPHDVAPMFIGALLGRYVFRRHFGAEKWRRYVPILLAGYGCGVGLVGMAAVALALIAKSVSQVVF